MVITTFDQALAGMQPMQFVQYGTGNITPVIGRHFSYWWTASSTGNNSVANPISTGVGGFVCNSSVALIAGQIPHYDPVSGNSYLARFHVLTGGGSLTDSYILADRLWHAGANSSGLPFGVVQTNAQAVNSVAWPPRDNNGTSNGAGVFVALEVISTMGAGSPTFTLTYVNSNGSTGMTSTNVTPYATASVQSSFYPFKLGNTEIGIQNVTSILASATQTSGNWGLVAYRPLAALDVPGVGQPNSVDVLNGFTQIYNGATPFVVLISGTTTAKAPTVTYRETQG